MPELAGDPRFAAFNGGIFGPNLATTAGAHLPLLSVTQRSVQEALARAGVGHDHSISGFGSLGAGDDHHSFCGNDSHVGIRPVLPARRLRPKH
jgi:hypothetical protein